MNLNKKKNLAKKVFKVGSDRIVFLETRIADIKDAITKQDIRDLEKSGAIVILEGKGRKKVRKRAGRSVGNIRKKIKQTKRDYIILTRKLRKYLKSLHARGEISREVSTNIRKKIRNKEFKSKSHLKEHIDSIGKTKGEEK